MGTMTDHPPGPREPGETAAGDQKQAELRDLLRLHALMDPYAPDGTTDIKDILPVMPAADRAEAEGILDRIDLLAAERQRSLARLHHVEHALRKLAEQGQPLIRDGQPVTDPHTGQVLKDPAFPGKVQAALEELGRVRELDRKSTRLNSSHLVISYAVFCLKKKKNIDSTRDQEKKKMDDDPQKE